MMAPVSPIPYLPTALAVAFGVSLSTTLLLTPFLRRFALKHHIVDTPDERKSHQAPIAYLGGVSIFIGIGVGLVTAYFCGYGANRDLWAWLLTGLAVIHLTGLLDDIKGTNPATKIAGQLIAGATLANLPGANLLAEDILHIFGLVNPPHFAIQMVAAAGCGALVLGATNAMNLIDGLDGLCASISAIGQLGFAAIALSILARNGQDASAQLALLLAAVSLAASLGFLKSNWHPATIFMGDAGSLLQGYLVAAQIVLLGTSAPEGKAGLCFLQSFGGLIVFGVPFADTALAFLRRGLNGKRLFAPDSLHLHHLLRRRYSIQKTVLLLCLCALVCALMGIAVSIGWPSRLVSFGVAVGGLSVALFLGYRAAMKRMVK